MRVLLCLAGLFAVGMAFPQNLMQQMMQQMMQGGSRGGNNYGYGNNYGNSGGGMGGQMGNFMNGMGQGMGGWNNNNNRNNNDMGGLFGIMLMHMLAQNMGDNMGDRRGDDSSSESSSSDDDHKKGGMEGVPREHIQEFQAWMKHQMAKEMAESIYLQIKVKEAKKEFEKAMEGLCMYVHVTYEWMKENNQTMAEPDFTDAQEDEWEEADDEGKGKIMWMLKEQDPDKYAAVGLKMGKWACYSGHALDGLLNKMEDKKECDGGKGDMGDYDKDSEDRERD